MAKKKAKPKGGKKGVRVFLTKANVTFPQPGIQDCFGLGTPFIAFGSKKTLGDSLVVGAEIVLPDGSSLTGVALTPAQFADDGTN